MNLENWINQKINDYIEPTRMGTPKGENIGLSKQKYRATLIMALTVNYSIKEIHSYYGSKLCSSYGLLRKWLCEEQFKTAMENHIAELDAILSENISDYILSRLI